MKRIVITLSLLVSCVMVQAQNEGRIGVFAGVNKTVLANVDDAAFGDFLPTFKPTVGIEAGYHFTLFKHLPMGYSIQLSNSKMGQNYRGYYADSTSYYAYSRLNYVRAGLAWHMGTNPRKSVSLDVTTGVNIGFLTNYQERYELIRYNNDRLILDIKDNEVNLYDTTELTGTITSPLYNKTDLNLFATIGLNFLISPNWVLGIYGRIDYGFSPVENSGTKMNINFDTEPSSSMSFKPYNTKVKYHGPTDDLITHSPTLNQAMGVYLSLHYRIYNKEKSDFYYKENDKYNN